PTPACDAIRRIAASGRRQDPGPRLSTHGYQLRMKSFLILAVCAAVASAQQPAPLPTTPAPQIPVRDSNNVALDRIVAVVGDQPITQSDIQERLLAMQQQPGFHPPKHQEDFKKRALAV